METKQTDKKTYICKDCKFMAVGKVDMSGYVPIGDTSTCHIDPIVIKCSQFSILCSRFKPKAKG